MKKHLLLFFLVAIAITAIGQTTDTIPNAGFEYWNNITYETPRNYTVTSNPEALRNGGNTPNLIKVANPADVHGGTYALKLSSTSNSMGYFLNSDPVTDPTPSAWTGGILYNQKPATIQGYYKYHSVNNADRATIIVIFKDVDGVTIGDPSIFNFGGEHDTYTQFSFAIPTLVRDPVKVIIGVTSSDLNAGGGKSVDGSVLFLDDISFTGVTSQPDLMNGDFELWDQGPTITSICNWFTSNGTDGVKRSTEFSAGQYALELKTFNQDDKGTMRIQPAQVSTNDYNSGNIGGIPFPYRVGKLVFSYKYTPVGSDKARVDLNFTKRRTDPNQDNTLNGGTGLSLSASATYTTVEIPFDINFIPDILNIQISSSDRNNGNTPVVDSKLIIDDLHFTDLGTRTWTGFQSNGWNNPNNWSPNMIPINTENVIIPDVSLPNSDLVINYDLNSPPECNNLTIEPGALLTIAPMGALTVNGNLTDNNAAGTVGASIQSNKNNEGRYTGSLIINGQFQGTGSALAQSYLTTNAWHIVSSPLSGQRIDNFLTDGLNANTIVTKGDDRGMMDYDPTLNKWNVLFTNTKSGILETSKGFAMHVGADDAIVTFTGSLQSGPKSVSGLSADNWNCIGNPYTSAIGINRNSSSVQNFLTVNAVNATNLDPNYGAIYVWDKTDASNGQTGQYTIISNTPVDVPAFNVQQGQAFFVKMNAAATSVNFTPAMQYHNYALALKSSEIAWPIIKLKASCNDQNGSTVIAFNSAMTKGLDPTYDAGLLKGSADLIVYSKLVEDNGIPFAIQALPDNNYSNTIIPIGLDFKTGGEVVFSSDLTHLPSDCKAILEDKLTKTFTDLSKDVYRTTIAPNSSIADRFFLHTSNANSGSEKESLTGKLTAFANRNIDIRIKGDVKKNTIATLYDIHGRVVLTKILEEGNMNVIPLPNIKIGIYMLSVKDNERLQGFKILVRE